VGLRRALNPSLRAKRSNPCRPTKKEWIASSQVLLAMTADPSSRSRGAIAPEFVAWRFVLSLRYLSSQLDRSKNNPQDLPMTIPFKTIRARAENRKGGPKARAKLLPPKPDSKALARLGDHHNLP